MKKIPILAVIITLLAIPNVTFADSLSDFLKQFKITPEDLSASYIKPSKWTPTSGGIYYDDTFTQNNENVGIGTDTPDTKLHVHSYVGKTQLRLEEGTKGYWDLYAGADFRINDDSPETRFFIKDGGDVGIGTDGPSDGSSAGGQDLKLDVQGAIGGTYYCDQNGLNCFEPSTNDSSTTNEIQDLFKTISIDGSSDIIADNATDTFTINGGTGINLSSNTSTDTLTIAAVDISDTNEIQTLGSTGTTPATRAVTLSDGGGATLCTAITGSAELCDEDDDVLTETEVDAYVSNNGYLTSEADGDPSNEIQTLGTTGTSAATRAVTLTDGGSALCTAITGSSELCDADDDELTEAEVDAYVDDNGYLEASDITAGSGINITGTTTLTISALDTSPTNEIQNLFTTINTPSGTDPVADTSSDTLNFATNSGISISGNSNTDTITFSVDDTSDSNEYNTGMTWNATTNTVGVTDGGGTEEIIITGFQEDIASTTCDDGIKSIADNGTVTCATGSTGNPVLTAGTTCTSSNLGEIAYFPTDNQFKGCKSDGASGYIWVVLDTMFE